MIKILLLNDMKQNMIKNLVPYVLGGSLALPFIGGSDALAQARQYSYLEPAENYVAQQDVPCFRGKSTLEVKPDPANNQYLYLNNGEVYARQKNVTEFIGDLTLDYCSDGGRRVPLSLKLGEDKVELRGNTLVGSIRSLSARMCNLGHRNGCMDKSEEDYNRDAAFMLSFDLLRNLPKEKDKEW